MNHKICTAVIAIVVTLLVCDRLGIQLWDGGGGPAPENVVKLFDDAVDDNVVAEIYGWTFLGLSDKLEADRAINDRAQIERLITDAGTDAKQTSGGIDNPKLPEAIGHIINSYYGTDLGAYGAKDRKAAVKAFRLIGNGLLQSARR